MPNGLSHITLITADLDRLEQILIRVLSARKVYDSGDDSFSLSPERFFLIGQGAGAVWVAIMAGPSLPERSYNHIAFSMAEAEYDHCLTQIRALGLEIRPSRERVEGEGRSIYFHDHDNHLFELHTGTLDQRLKRYAQGKPA
ncbi:FosX/FosE/FosI family fosfomycin resistance hydrolase [Paracoccus jiaweipingae]|uniref:FosX/FosE/FosI family fosfomycin resistance hydrolase n=1 Tax=unclassified Paracoccus (in: a-proteobacteria) TaxID=2688777 RepID=UPI0037BB6168